MNILRRTIPNIRIIVWCLLLLSPAVFCTALSAAEAEVPCANCAEHAVTGITRPQPPPSVSFSDSIPLVPAGPAAAHAREEQSRDLRPLVTRGDSSYENVTLAEDVTWRGTVLIRGYLVIAPQATVRIEPGTVVRFMKSPILRQAPRLVVMGRLQCSGTSDNPVIFAPNLAVSASGDWGGILLLSSEKRNQLDNVRIEGAETGIEARFSTLTAKGLHISRSTTGLLLRDCIATLSALTVSGAETGLEIQDSEFDLRDSTLEGNRRGIVARHATLVLGTVTIRDSAQQGITADECRIRFSACDLTGNGGGARLSGGEGQITRSRFLKNRDSALQLVNARIRINQSLFADTSGDAVRTGDGRSVLWGCAFSANSGYNLVNTGHEEISAVQNWWGSAREADITAKLSAAAENAAGGKIAISPWLSQKPALLP